MANNYDAIINGVEFAIDYGLQVSDEDWNAYQKAIKMRKRKEKQQMEEDEKQNKAGNILLLALFLQNFWIKNIQKRDRFKFCVNVKN